MKHIKRFVILILFPTFVSAADFIELKMDPGEHREFDNITVLINRSIISYVDISESKTPERAWYHVNIYVMNSKAGSQDKEFKSKLLSLECDNSKIVNEIKEAVFSGAKKMINGMEACRRIVE